MADASAAAAKSRYAVESGQSNERGNAVSEQVSTPGGAEPGRLPAPKRQIHEVRFVSYPKFVFVWPLILAGLIFWPFGKPPEKAPAPGAAQTLTINAPAAYSERLEVLGWAYIWIVIIVLLTLGVDIDRNQLIFLAAVFGLFWVLGLWLKDAKHITIFGDAYRWFCALDVQYNRSLGVAVSLILLVPYVFMLVWSRLNQTWRMTHNELEHRSFGRTDDSLGRGAKGIRTSYTDVLEFLLGLAGTLVVYDATGTRELRRIPHVLFLPMVRRRLDRILEATAIVSTGSDEQEEEQAAGL
jgi:hypothetical protein